MNPLAALIVGVEDCEGADDGGDDAAAVDVADQKGGDIGGGGKAHIGEIAVAQIDLGGAAGAFDDERSASPASFRKLSRMAGMNCWRFRKKSRAVMVARRWPWTITWAPVLVSGLSSTGFMWTVRARRGRRGPAGPGRGRFRRHRR